MCEVLLTSKVSCTLCERREAARINSLVGLILNNGSGEFKLEVLNLTRPDLCVGPSVDALAKCV